MKINRFISYLNQYPTHQIQSPDPSPTNNDPFSIFLFYLNQILTTISNFFNTMISPETRTRFIDYITQHWISILLASVLLIFFVCCCLPIIISCITWVIVGIFNIIKGIFMILINVIKSVFRCFCCCGSRSGQMMKAPGRGGRVFIPRASFESNPAGYFQSLRASPRLY